MGLTGSLDDDDDVDDDDDDDDDTLVIVALSLGRCLLSGALTGGLFGSLTPFTISAIGVNTCSSPFSLPTSLEATGLPGKGGKEERSGGEGGVTSTTSSFFL